MQLITAGLLATALAASTSLSFAQGSSKGAASGADELHRIMMSSAKESQSMKPSGDVDRDFLTMMRHHHQSGVRMSEVEIRHGKNSAAKALAQKIVEGQKKEIAEIDALLGKHPSAKK
jgi:uncharacterized protein (DUF305 family)